MRYLFLIFLLTIPLLKSIAQTTDSNNNWFDLIDEISKDTTKNKPLFNNESSDTNSTTDVENPVSIIADNSFNSEQNYVNNEESDTIEDPFKPEIGLGAGVLSFMGDINASYRKNPLVGRIGRSIIISRKIHDIFSVNF